MWPEQAIFILAQGQDLPRVAFFKVVDVYFVEDANQHDRYN